MGALAIPTPPSRQGRCSSLSYCEQVQQAPSCPRSQPLGNPPHALRPYKPRPSSRPATTLCVTLHAAPPQGLPNMRRANSPPATCPAKLLTFPCHLPEGSTRNLPIKRCYKRAHLPILPLLQPFLLPSASSFPLPFLLAILLPLLPSCPPYRNPQPPNRPQPDHTPSRQLLRCTFRNLNSDALHIQQSQSAVVQSPEPPGAWGLVYRTGPLIAGPMRLLVIEQFPGRKEHSNHAGSGNERATSTAGAVKAPMRS